MQLTRIDDWTSAYDNRAAVPTHETYFYDWGRAAAAYRAANAPREIAYGETERERLDLFLPEETPRGLTIYVHGGWWMNFDKSYFSHAAAGAVARGWAVAVPSYTLCPDIFITGIVEQIARAVAGAAEAVPDGPIVISGHSAGGQLAAMMGVEDGPLRRDVLDRVARLFPVSGLHDLRPLMKVIQNAHLRIDAEEAAVMSPALRLPRRGFDLVASVGGAELPEFRRQNAMLGAMWGGHVDARVIETPYENHFDVVAAFASPHSAMSALATLSEPAADHAG